MAELTTKAQTQIHLMFFALTHNQMEHSPQNLKGSVLYPHPSAQRHFIQPLRYHLSTPNHL